MDDYTWKQKMRERQARRRHELLALFLFIAALLGTAAWYFGVYVRTPQYALGQIVDAIGEKDAERFRRYVDLPTLTSHAYDDLTVDLFAYDSALTPGTKVLFERFYVLIKPQLTEGTGETILARVQNGYWTLPEGLDILKGRQLGIDYERFLERSQVRNTTLQEIGEIERSGRTATAKIAIVEDYTQTPFTLELVMEETEEGDWRVSYIKNYKAYLDTVTPKQNRDIAEYIENTREIVEENNARFRDQQKRFGRMVSTRDGEWTAAQKTAIYRLIMDEVIPTLKQRQRELDEIPVPAGAAYLSRLRQQSTEITISTWHHFLQGMDKDDQAEFDTAESLHKQQMEIDLRIEDIIKHTAVSKNIPNIP